MILECNPNRLLNLYNQTARLLNMIQLYIVMYGSPISGHLKSLFQNKFLQEIQCIYHTYMQNAKMHWKYIFLFEITPNAYLLLRYQSSMWKLHDTFTVCYNMTMFRKTEEIQIKSWRCFQGVLELILWLQLW